MMRRLTFALLLATGLASGCETSPSASQPAETDFVAEFLVDAGGAEAAAVDIDDVLDDVPMNREPMEPAAVAYEPVVEVPVAPRSAPVVDPVEPRSEPVVEIAMEPIDQTSGRMVDEPAVVETFEPTTQPGFQPIVEIPLDEPATMPSGTPSGPMVPLVELPASFAHTFTVRNSTETPVDGWVVDSLRETLIAAGGYDVSNASCEIVVVCSTRPRLRWESSRPASGSHTRTTSLWSPEHVRSGDRVLPKWHAVVEIIIQAPDQQSTAGLPPLRELRVRVVKAAMEDRVFTRADVRDLWTILENWAAAYALGPRS